VNAKGPSLRHNRDFTRLWIGEAASGLGSQIGVIAYPLLVLELTGSPAKAGLVGFARMLPWFVLSLPAGVLVDRWNRKVVMIACDVGALLAVASIPIAFWAGALSFGHVLVVALLESCFYVFFYLSEPGAIRRIVPAELLPDAVARNEARDRAANLAGAPIGGFLFGVGRVWPFVADAVSYLVSLTQLLGIKTEFQGERASRRSLRRLHLDVAQGFAWFWREPFLRACEILTAGTNVTSTALSLAVIVVATEQGASPTLIGVMFAIIATGGLLGAMAAPRLRRRIPAPLIILGLPWTEVLVLPLLAIAPHPLVLGILAALIKFGGPVWNAVAVGYQITVVPDEFQGRVRSVATLFSFSTMALGPLLAGYALEAIGGDATFLVLAGYALVIASAGLLSTSLRHFPEVGTGSASGLAETDPEVV
jgi:MFS family permease